ncbi:MAG: CoA transferase [Myxococcota bacterium]
MTGETEAAPGFAAGALASAARGLGRALDRLAPARGFDALDAPALLGERAALFGLVRRGRISCGGSARLLLTRAGWLALHLPRDDDWSLVPAWLEGAVGSELCDRASDRERAWRAIERALADRTAAPLVSRGREIGLAIADAAPRPRPATLPFRLDHATRTAPSTPSATHAGASLRPPLCAHDAGHTNGIGDLRVLDLSNLWAGPLAGALLAQAGAEVLKVESPKRPDGARAGEARFFDLLNADKHGCALDLARAEDLALFFELLESADVVLESNRPRALAQLGIDARAWLARRPGRIWASITGYGRDHEWIAFGDDAAVAAGLAFDPTGAALPPRFCADAIADPLTGLTAAAAILALRAQGRGGLLGLALADVAAYAANAANAADLTADPTAANATTLPVTRQAGAWQVHAGHAVIPVAAPRARTPRGCAPDLAPPGAALLAAWTRAC